MMRKAGAAAAIAAAMAVGMTLHAQGRRPASPAGNSAVEVGGHYDPKAAEPTYDKSGTLAVMWENTLGSVAFTF